MLPTWTLGFWILSTALCDVLELSSDWPRGTAPIVLSSQWSILTDCQQQCFNAATPGFRTFTDTKANCVDLPSTFTKLDECIDLACASNDTSVTPAQEVLKNYCVDLEGRVSSLGADASFTISSVPEIPISTASTILASGLIPAYASTTAPATTGPATTTSNTASAASQTNSSTVLDGAPADLGAAGLQSSANSPAPAKNSNGLSQKEQIGIGVGVGVGVPLIVGLVAALYFISRRRSNKASDRANAYGPVYASDKGAMEDGGDHSGPPDSHPMNSSATPFLPVPVAGGLQHHDEHEHDTDHERDHDFERTHEPLVDSEPSRSGPLENESRVQPHPPVPLIIPPTQPQSQTTAPAPPSAPETRESDHAQPPIDDEAPSPVSPMSPVSEMGSRPASLHSYQRHRDL
nr:hypothetical protein CFP56_62887 [Quercus suber]